MSSKQVVAAARSSESIQSSGGYVASAAKAYESSTTSSTTRSSSHISSSARHSSGGSTYIGGGGGATTISSSSGSAYAITNGTKLINGSSTYIEKEYSLIDGIEISREKERAEFSDLNVRLANYIQIVRSLHLTKEEVDSLVDEVQHLQITTTVDKVGGDYRKLVAEQSVIEDELRHSKQGLVASLQTMTENYHNEQRKVNDLQSQLDKVALEIGVLSGQNNDYSKLVEVNQNSYEEIREQVDVDIGHRIHEIIQHYTGEYEALKAQLLALRSHFARVIQQNNAKIAGMCEIKFGAIDISAHADYGQRLDTFQSEIRHYQSLVKKTQVQISAQEATIADYERQIEELKRNWERDHVVVGGVNQNMIASIQATFKGQFESHVRAYKLLLEDNIRLIAELNTYYILLSREENRLHITHVVDHHSGHEFVVKSHSDIDVVIDEVNMQGNYVHLTNKGTRDWDLNNWKLVSTVGVQSETYKLQTTQPLQPGKSITIWSANRGGTNNPPASYVMNGTWPSGNRIFIQLFDTVSSVPKASVTAYYEVDVDVKTVEYGSFKDSMFAKIAY
jgi:hypothetical protein